MALAACASAPVARPVPAAPQVAVAAPVAPAPEAAPVPVVAPPAAPPISEAAAVEAPAPSREERSAPALRSSFADVSIAYDAPGHVAEKPATPVDGNDERPGIGAGIERPIDVVAHMQVPRLSLARPPRPKRDYTNLRISGASQFAGRTIRVELVIDERGTVRQVRLLQGVDRTLDRRTIALVRAFSYEPARDDDGMVIAGTAVWNIHVVFDGDEDPFRAVSRLRL